MRTSHLVSTSTLSKVQCVSGLGQGRAQLALQHQDDVLLGPDPVFGNSESRKRFVSYHSSHGHHRWVQEVRQILPDIRAAPSDTRHGAGVAGWGHELPGRGLEG